MAGLLTFALAGAGAGLGRGIVDRAEKAREDALRQVEREWHLSDEARRRGYDVEDRDLGYARDDLEYGRARSDRLSDYAMQRRDALSDEARGYAREDARVSRTADALGVAYGSGDDTARINLDLDGGNTRYATQWLIERGYEPHIAAGLTGNLMQESGPGLDTRAVGDNGNAFGAGQWNGPRRRALLQFAKERGAAADDLDTQLEFLDWEMNNTERGARDAIMAARTPEDAARIASEKFWRPGVPHIERRQSYARQVFEALADPETPTQARDMLAAKVAPDGGDPVDLETFEGSDGARYAFNPRTGEARPITGTAAPDAPTFRPATPEEAGAYGSQAGQIDTETGRFYPASVPKGMTIESDGAGGFRMTEGPLGADGKFTEGQAKKNVYSTRARGAMGRLEAVGDEVLTGIADSVAQNVPLVGRYAQSEDYQVARQAADEFLMAILRDDTGAAITEPENQRYYLTYLPQPGDTPGVITAKRQARTTAAAALEAGMSSAQIEARDHALVQAARASELADARRADPQRTASPRLTPDDRASPLPNDVIDDGKAAIDGLLGEASAGAPPPAPVSPLTAQAVQAMPEPAFKRFVAETMAGDLARVPDDVLDAMIARSGN